MSKSGHSGTNQKITTTLEVMLGSVTIREQLLDVKGL